MSDKNSKFNKDVSGYLMLLILAESDGNFDKREGQVIVDYIKDKFPLGGNLEDALETISNLNPEEYEQAFLEASSDFYKDSTSAERTDFLRFSMKLARADKKVDEYENVLITKLFEAWDI